MKLPIRVVGALLLLLIQGLFSCQQAAKEKEAEEDGFHLHISSKGGDVEIDASGKDKQKNKKDKNGFHLNLSSDDEDESDGFDLKIEGKGAKMDSKALNKAFPEYIGWYKRDEFKFQNALGFVSTAEVTYTKGKQEIKIAVLGGALGSLAGGFSDLLEGDFDLKDSDMRQKTGEWQGLKYIEGYNDDEEKAFLHTAIDNKMVVVVGGENISEGNFSSFWKKINWKALSE